MCLSFLEIHSWNSGVDEGEGPSHTYQVTSPKVARNAILLKPEPYSGRESGRVSRNLLSLGSIS